MSKQQKGLVPELRFPEFEKEPNWPCVRLNAVAKRSTGKNKGEKVSRVLTNSAVDGVVDQRDYFEKDIAVKGNLESYYIVDKGDYVYNPRISSTAPVGPISKNKVGKGVMSPLYTVFKFNSKKNDFFEQFFKSSRWHGYLQTISNIGARHDRMSITSSEFMAMPVPNPGDMEQQKIADCLASIDELITLHTQKLDALKDHKKGLMQQLFPTEGEAVPKLRFPEFLGSNDWQRKMFGDVVQRSFYGTSRSTSDAGVYPVLRMGNMVDGKIQFENLVYIDLSGKEFEKLKLESGDILFNRTNSYDLVGKVSLFNEVGNYVTASYIVTFRLKTDLILPSFCNQLLNTGYYQSLIKVLATRAVSQANINPSKLKDELEVLIPCLNEQVRITDFLESIDALISDQSEKLSELKSHKSGLIQKLFPVLDEEV